MLRNVCILAGRASPMVVTKRSYQKVTSLTPREFRMAMRLGKRKKLPPCHYEFLDVITALEKNGFDDQHPEVLKATEICDKCFDEEDQRKKKGQASSVSYHLSRYVQKSQKKK